MNFGSLGGLSTFTKSQGLKIPLPYYVIGCSGVANSIIGGGGAHIHIFEFTDHKNNRFQTKLIAQNMNI